MKRIKKIFQTRNKKVIPYFTAGYPRKEDTISMVLAAESAGAAMVELGMPFSDPLADGPVIQTSSRRAIENGVNLPWILETVLEIRKQSEIPIILMGYINPIIKHEEMVAKYNNIDFIKKKRHVDFIVDWPKFNMICSNTLVKK